MVKTLDELTPEDLPFAGAKAVNCARLKRAGFPVPDGAVVLASATEADIRQLPSHPWVEQCSLDARFAVRSSSAEEDRERHSFAGVFETRLDVALAELADAVLACRASARSARAIAYRRRLAATAATLKGRPTYARRLAAILKGRPAAGPPDQAMAIGVLIQLMVPASAAGVGFTIDPVGGAPDVVVINAAHGVGESLVAGRIDPDEFRVRKGTGEIVASRSGRSGVIAPATEPSLTDAQVLELTHLLEKVERHYGAPQDVEWCHDGAQFWVVQSRPVTTAAAGAADKEWTRANLVEVLPEMPAPQVASAVAGMLNRAEVLFLGRLLAPDASAGPMVKTSRPGARRFPSYWSASRILAGFCSGTFVSRGSCANIRGRLNRFCSGSRRSIRTSCRMPCSETASYSGCGRRRSISKSCCSSAACCFTKRGCRRCATAWACASSTCSTRSSPQANERSVSAQQAFDLVDLARAARREPRVVSWIAQATGDLSGMREALGGTRFLEAFERFLAKYGHRGRYESDWSLPRYREDPAPLVAALRAHLRGGLDIDGAPVQARQAREAGAAWSAFERRLTRWQRVTILPRARRAVAIIKQYYLWREDRRSELMKVLAVLRPWHLALADRFVQRGWLDRPADYFLLHLEEVGEALASETAGRALRAIARRRAAEMDRYRRLEMPLLLVESALPGLVRSPPTDGDVEDERQLTGLPVSAGCVEGEVIVLDDPGDIARMKPGAILVTRATDPSWTPLFTLARGIIVEVGGVLSHASTVAREYGLPALANVKRATRRLKTGERVRLDANAGVVERLEGPAKAGRHDSRRV